MVTWVINGVNEYWWILPIISKHKEKEALVQKKQKYLYSRFIYMFCCLVYIQLDLTDIEISCLSTHSLPRACQRAHPSGQLWPLLSPGGSMDTGLAAATTWAPTGTTKPTDMSCRALSVVMTVWRLWLLPQLWGIALRGSVIRPKRSRIHLGPVLLFYPPSHLGWPSGD